MSKKTDKEVIKALECCNTEYDDYQCPHCPLLHKGCKKALIQEALDLINRQQAEIERLKEELEIRNQKRASIFEISNAYERGRAEAIKEYKKN